MVALYPFVHFLVLCVYALSAEADSFVAVPSWDHIRVKTRYLFACLCLYAADDMLLEETLGQSFWEGDCEHVPLHHSKLVVLIQIPMPLLIKLNFL